MTDIAAHPAGASRGKGINITLWVLQVLLALAFLGAASGKLLGNAEMVALFETLGLGQWFRYLTGGLELVGAVLLVVPKTRFIGAVLLAVVMVGAIGTHLFVLHNAPTAPLVLFLVAGLIAWGRRSDLPRMLGR